MDEVGILLEAVQLAPTSLGRPLLVTHQLNKSRGEGISGEIEHELPAPHPRSNPSNIECKL